MHKTPLQIFSTFKQDKVKLANPIFKRTRQAAAKVKIEREKQVRNIFAFLLFRNMQMISLPFRGPLSNGKEESIFHLP